MRSEVRFRAQRWAAVGVFCGAFAAVQIPIDRLYAQADRQKTDASLRFGQGVDLFQEGAYEGALVEFEQAYRLAPDYRVLFNIGQARIQLKNYVGAVEALEEYLKQAGKALTAEREAVV